MQYNDLKDRQKSHCSTKIVAVPELMICPKCGYDMEIWTDEDETICISCGHRFFKKETILH